MVHIFRRSRTYYARLVLPSDLRAILDRKVLKRSLGTSVYREAQVKACQWAGLVAELFLRLRGEPMTKEDVRRLVQEYQDSELDAWEEDHINGQLSDDRDTISLVLTDRLEDIEGQLISADYKKVKPIAEQLLNDHQRTLSTDSPEFLRLCHSLLVAQQTVLMTELDRLEGRWYHGRVLDAPSSRGLVEKASEPVSISLGEAVKLYFEHYDHRDKRTNEEKLAVMRRFIETLPLGDTTPLHRVKKPEAIRFRDAYAQLPKRVLNKHRGLPVLDLLAKLKDTDYVKVTKSTVNHALTDVRHFFVWAIRHDHYLEPRNPFDGIDLEGVKEEHYGAYTDEELLLMFNDPDYLQQREEYPARYWLPLICLYTGARRGEIDQLTPKDVKLAAVPGEQGIYYFDITECDETGKRTKNDISKRRVPIHSRLIDLGLLQYWARHLDRPLLFFKQPTKGARPGGRKTCGDSVSKWLAALRKRVGIKGKNKVMHSFRDTVITRLLSAGCSEDLRKVLTGHSAGDVHGDVYVKRDQISMVLLKEKMELLKLPV